MELMPGARVKNYTLERQLGKGASGEVWRAYDETKTVAIKFMNENLMKSASAAKHRERLLREVEALRRLEHPNVPTLYDYDLDYVRPYLAMRYVGGDSYDRLISTGEMLKISLEKRLEAIRELAFALTAAHEAGIIHRDIKPANMTGIENPFLLDFSIALAKADAERTARFVGTTLYMAPDGIVDRMSDNYSFAVVVYEMLFGRHPIYQLGDSLFNQFIAEMRIQNRQWSFPSLIPPAQLPADLRTADLRKLDMVFERAIGSREQRYSDLREFVRDLRGAIFNEGNPPVEHFSSVGSAPPMEHFSQPPPIPEHVSHAPQAEPALEQEPVVEVSPKESDFLDKAFLNLPAVKPPPEISVTSVEHHTVSYDNAAQKRASELEPEFAGPDDGTRMEMRAAPPPPEPEPAEADFAGPEDGTRMEMPAAPPPVPAEDEPSSEFSAPDAMTMMEMRAAPQPTEPEAPPAPVDMSDRTMPDIRVPPPQPSHAPQPENFTQMEMQVPQQQRQPQGESFTMMEMQAAQPRSVPDPFENENFTQMEMQAPERQTRFDVPTSLGGVRARRLLIIGLVVIVVVVVLIIVIAALTGGARVS